MSPCKSCQEFKEKHVRMKIESGNPSDYILNCVPSGSCTCKKETIELICINATSTCAAECPSPLPNSHLISNTCIWIAACTGVYPLCTPCVCGIFSGSCSYDCDAGYVWNPVTLTCDLIPVPSMGMGSSFSPILMVTMAYFIQKRRKKRKRLTETFIS